VSPPSPIGPRACYDEGKRVGETLMFDHHRMYGTAVRVVRIFNTYGPYMHPYDGRVVSNFVRQALSGDDITVYGDGSQTRSFQFASDLVEGLMRMMENEDGFTGPVNLGNPDEFTIAELAQLVVAKVASGSRVVHAPLPADDPRVRRPDIAVAAARLGGWRPVVALDKGLDATIAYFRALDLSRFTPPTKNYGKPNPDTVDRRDRKDNGESKGE
jgi:UDP-glucuronate decarboxylase